MRVQNDKNYLCVDGIVRRAVVQDDGKFALSAFKQAPDTVVDIAGVTADYRQFVVQEVVLVQSGQRYMCADGKVRVAHHRGDGKFQMQGASAVEVALPVVDQYGMFTNGKQFVLHAHTSDKQAMAVCTYTVNAKVTVQVSVPYNIGQSVSSLQAKAEEMAQAALPKDLQIIDVVGLDIKV